MINNFKNFGILPFILFLFLALQLSLQISKSLLWNDEAYTAVYTQRTLAYGYPKNNDGKNDVYLGLTQDGKKVFSNESLDANVEIGWLNYYFLVPFEMLASQLDNIYLQTFCLRFPYVLLGLWSIFNLIFLLKTKAQRGFRGYIALFLFFIIISVSFHLNITEVRYYAPTVFLLSLLLKIYAQTSKYKFVYILGTLVSLFHIFFPAFFIAIFSLGLFEIINFSKHKNKKLFLETLYPLLASVLINLPFFFFYKIISFQNFAVPENSPSYLNNLTELFSYLWKYEFLLLFIILKGIKLIVFFFLKQHRNKLHLISIYDIFFFSYAFIICLSPIPFLFTRYYLFLIPLMYFILIFDLVEITPLFKGQKAFLLGIMVICLAQLFIPFHEKNIFDKEASSKYKHIKNYYASLLTPYEGPLDIVIPYLKQHYRNTESLIVASNYEEPSLIYYLHCKTIIGLKQTHLMADTLLTPDIVFYRKMWAQESPAGPFESLIQKASYEKIQFPVFDYMVNQIPQLNYIPHHLYFTKKTNNPAWQTTIFVHENNLLEKR